MKDLKKGQLKAIATRCSAYEPQESGRFISTLNDGFFNQGNATCEYCTHYENRKCKLNLIDEILDDMGQ